MQEASLRLPALFFYRQLNASFDNAAPAKYAEIPLKPA
jgi:hypothetical protein